MPPARRHDQNPIIKILNTVASDPGIITITAVILIGVYLLDSVTPRGEPVWLLYFIPLILSVLVGTDVCNSCGLCCHPDLPCWWFFRLSRGCGDIPGDPVPVYLFPLLHQCIDYPLDDTPAANPGRTVVIQPTFVPGHIVSNFIPGPDGVTDPGRREFFLRRFFGCYKEVTEHPLTQRRNHREFSLPQTRSFFFRNCSISP